MNNNENENEKHALLCNVEGGRSIELNCEACNGFHGKGSGRYS